MSSLRLALKQSLEESGATLGGSDSSSGTDSDESSVDHSRTASPKRDDHHHHHHLNTSGHSHHSHSSHQPPPPPVVKVKRGPGRPRKHPLPQQTAAAAGAASTPGAANQNPPVKRKRGRPPKKQRVIMTPQPPPSHDQHQQQQQQQQHHEEDDFSSENEFSHEEEEEEEDHHSDEEEEDSKHDDDHDDDEEEEGEEHDSSTRSRSKHNHRRKHQRSSAASKIQSHWKKKKNGPSTSTTSDHPTAAASVAAGTSSTAHSSRKQPTPEPTAASASVERRDHEPAASTSHPSSAATTEPSNRKSPPPHQSAATSSTTAETEAASKPPQQQQEDANNNENKAAPEKPKNKKTKTVPPPVPEVLEWTRNLPVKRARKFMTQGLRVKVRFSTKVKREGKIVRKKKWFGGRVSAVSKKGSKIRIKYDDGTTEETKFPDKDVVVDDTSNGQHGSAVVANAEKFIPPSALKESRHGHDAAAAADGHVVADERKQPAIQHGAKQQHGKEEHAASKREHQHAGHAPPTMSSEHDKPQAMEIDKGSSSTAPAAAAASDPTAPHDVNTPMKPVKRKRGRPPKHRPPVQPPAESSAAAESAPGDAHVKKYADHGTATTAAGGHHKRHVSAGSHEQQQQQQQEAMDIQSDRAAGLFLSAGDADTNQQHHQQQQQSGPDNEQRQEQRESLADAFAVAEPGAADDGSNSNKNAAEAVPASPSSKKATLKIRLSKSSINVERSQSTENAMQVDQQQQQQTPEQQPPPARGGVSLKGFADAAAPSQEMDVVTEKAPENKPIVARHKKRPSSSMSATGADTNDGEPPLKRLHIHISKSSKKEPASSEQQDERETATPPIEEGQVNSDKNTGDAGDEPSKPMPMLAKQPQATTETQSHSSPNTARKIKRKRMEAAAAAGEAIPALPITTRVAKGTAEDQQAALAGFAAASASQMGDDKEAGSLVGSKNSAFDKKDGLSIKAPPTEDSQQLAEGSKATLTPRGGRGKKDFSVEAVPVRSGRRAAQEANERITNKPEPSDKDQMGKKKKKRAHRHEGGEGEAGADPEGGEFQWVQCDGCAKWRIIPSIVVDSLPSEWFCADNKWDPKRATCEAPEQTAKQIAREKKRKKRQRLLMEKAAAESAAAGEMQGAEPEAASMDRERSKSPKPTQEATVAPEETQMPSSATTSSRPTRRPSPAESLHSEPGAVSDLKKPEKKSAPPAKRARGNAATAAATESVAVAPEEPPPPPPALPPAEPKRGRGRPRRNPIKESGPAPTTPGGKDGDDGDNLEWVQCEKCDKWRKLPPHISADELPDIWYCQMNTWNPSSASCEVPEDKAEGLQDIFSNGGSGAAKLSYRNLIFGSNGRRAGRPISERTRAAESLFATVSDDNEAPPTVMYANSGAFICRSKAHQQEENTGPSVLDIMSNSHLWKELNGAAQPDGKRMPFYSFDMLPNKLQESMKDLALNSLATQTLTGEEVHAEIQARNWDNVPQGWTAVREYCSVNVLVVALCQLVKEGVLECVQKKHLTLSADVGGQDWDLAYRRAKMYSQAILPAAEKSGDGGPADMAADDSSRSRCMKFRKPWKK